MPEILYQGAKDIFLAKVRADFNKIEDQALKSMSALKQHNLLGSDPMAESMFIQVGPNDGGSDRAVWRHVSVAGAKKLGTRKAGGQYPEAEFIRGYETAVFDPDEQIAGKFVVAEERQAKEGVMFSSELNRAKKLLQEIDRANVYDPFEVFNLAFTAPTSYPTRFFARGNMGLDGTNTALNERLISTQHARADAGPTQSNAVTSSGLASALSDTTFYAAKEQAATFKDDVGKPMPMMGGRVTLIVPPSNGLLRTAAELNQSELKVDTANNNINIHKGLMGDVKSSPYLLTSAYVSGVANTKAWFAADEGVRDAETGLGLMQILFVALTTKTQFEEGTDSIVYKVKYEPVYGWVDWRNFIGSNGLETSYTS